VLIEADRLRQQEAEGTATRNSVQPACSPLAMPLGNSTPHCEAKLLAARCSTLSEMDILKMLAELRAEREQVEEAILVLERMARGRGKRRGRPPKWITGMKRRGRPPGSKNKLK